MENSATETILCPTGRCGVQSVRNLGGVRHCGKCFARLGTSHGAGMQHHEESFYRHMREVQEFTANRLADSAQDAVSGATLLADPPLPVKQRPLLDIVSEIHQLTHELAERLAKA